MNMKFNQLTISIFQGLTENNQRQFKHDEETNMKTSLPFVLVHGVRRQRVLDK